MTKKYHIKKKNEGTWIKWSVVDEKGIARFIGIAKEAKEFIKNKMMKDEFSTIDEIKKEKPTSEWTERTLNARIPGLMLSQRQIILELLAEARQEVVKELKKQCRKGCAFYPTCQKCGDNYAELCEDCARTETRQETTEKIKKILMDNISIDTLKQKKEIDKIYEEIKNL